MNQYKRNFYPAYMKRKRHPKTDDQIKYADKIRQKLIAIVSNHNYTVKVEINSKNKPVARICPADNNGLGFIIPMELANSLDGSDWWGVGQR